MNWVCETHAHVWAAGWVRLDVGRKIANLEADWEVDLEAIEKQKC